MTPGFCGFLQIQHRIKKTHKPSRKLWYSCEGYLDVKIGGGVETVRQYLSAGLIDELHFALSPVVLGQGEAMFAGIDLPALGYRVTEHQATEHATHVVLAR